MALTELDSNLERQKDSISWEPISEWADFITTLSYKRGSTIPWCRTLQKSIIRQDETLSPHCPLTNQLFNTVSYQNTLYNFFKSIMKRGSTVPYRILQEVGYYEVETYFIRTLYWPTNGAQVTWRQRRRKNCHR